MLRFVETCPELRLGVFGASGGGERDEKGEGGQNELAHAISLPRPKVDGVRPFRHPWDMTPQDFATCRRWCSQQKSWEKERAAWAQRYKRPQVQPRAAIRPQAVTAQPRVISPVPPPPPPAGYCRKPDGTRYPCTLRGAVDDGGSKLWLVFLPLAAVAGIGLWAVQQR